MMHDRVQQQQQNHRIITSSKFSTWAQSGQRPIRAKDSNGGGSRGVAEQPANVGRQQPRRSSSVSSEYVVAVVDSKRRCSPSPSTGSVTPPLMPPPLTSDNSMYLMVDPCTVPNTLGPEIRVFDLHDVLDANIGIRHIVGYCLPMRGCVGIFKDIHPWRAIKTVDGCSAQVNDEQFMRRYKFQSQPLRVAPLHDKEFHKMMRSAPAPLRNSGDPQRNRFYVRPSSPSPDQHQKRNPFDDTAMNFAQDKFKLDMNPHLIAYRLPDGLNCYIRLELAQHCQHDFTKEDQPPQYSQNNPNNRNYRCVRQNSFREELLQEEQTTMLMMRKTTMTVVNSGVAGRQKTASR